MGTLLAKRKSRQGGERKDAGWATPSHAGPPCQGTTVSGRQKWDEVRSSIRAPSFAFAPRCTHGLHHLYHVPCPQPPNLPPPSPRMTPSLHHSALRTTFTTTFFTSRAARSAPLEPCKKRGTGSVEPSPWVGSDVCGPSQSEPGAKASTGPASENGREVKIGSRWNDKDEDEASFIIPPCAGMKGCTH